MSIPFSVYDFFAYLSSGAVVLAAVDYIWQLGVLLQKDIGPPYAIALIILAYIVGQILAHFSSFFYERTIANRILRNPSVLLLGGKPRSKFVKYIFPNYHRPLPHNIQERVRQQALSRNCDADGEALFYHAYPLVTKNEKFQARLDDFRNQYGFARNISFALLVSALAVSIAHLCGRPARSIWAILLVFGAIVIFYRYLKFFHLYAQELFLRYSEI